MKYLYILAEISRQLWAITPEAMRGILSALEDKLGPEDRGLFHAADLGAVVGHVGEDYNSGRARVVNGVGVITIDGPIVPRGNALHDSSGLVSIDRLTTELKTFQADPQIREILFLIDSPGGATTGVSELASLIEKTEKPTSAYVYGFAASAAYWIASATDRITVSDTGLVGSIGTVLTVRRASENDPIEIVSAQSPNKRPDPETDEGRRELQRIVDGIAKVFIDTVARNRSVSAKDVTEKFGRGGLLLAPEALAVGMIDAVSTLDDYLAEEVENDDTEGDEEIPFGATTTNNSDTVETATELTSGAIPAFKDFPIVDRPWDAAAADRRVREFTGSKKQPAEFYKNAFFWYDDKKADQYTSYKLPFADIDGGRMVAVKKGVQAANGAMSGARGGVSIPAADKSKVQNHIDRYLKKIEKQKNNGARGADKNSGAKTMSDLNALMAENPGAKAELDKLLADARADGAKEADETIKARLDAASKIIDSDYPAKIKAIALAVAKGEKSVEQLDTAVAVYDSIKADADIKSAQADSAAVPPTPPQTQGERSTDGVVRTEADIEAAVAEMKSK